MKKITIETRRDRNEFYARTLGGFGISLQQALTPKLPTRIEVQGKEYDFGSPLPADFDPFELGFSGPRVWAEGCLGWIWWQWLHAVPGDKIREPVEFVVNRGMEMQQICPNQRFRGLHDLWLLNCAILASSEGQLLKLAETVVDSKGDKEPPKNNGELFAAAWCGALKHWILDDRRRAAQELEVATKAYRYDIAKVAPKPLAMKWLAAEWKGFAKLQQKDFQALWNFLRKHRLVTENGDESLIQFDSIPVPGRGWCWSHCGLAMLAHRQGATVATDPFWFPPHALKCVEPGLSAS